MLRNGFQNAAATADFYELVVARHLRSATIVTSNRGPDEWLTVMTDAMLAESAIDRLTSAAHELIVEGPSYRQRQKPTVDSVTNPSGPGVPSSGRPTPTGCAGGAPAPAIVGTWIRCL